MTETSPTRGRTATSYDAIVVGGGHNGLTNAAYLAKSGLRTLVLEQRPFVGGAAITEELRPGFSFTTFSYALSLLRPEIVHELNLVEHGFLPLMMPGDFHPTGDGGYLLFGDDEEQNVQMIRQHSKHDADAYVRYNFDLDRVIQTVRPLFDNPPPDIFGSDPEDQADVGWMLKGVRDGSRRFIGSEAIRRELVDGTSRWATTGIVVDWADWDRLHRDAGELPTKDEQSLGWEQWLRADPEGTGEQVGYVTSFCYSPVMQRHIGIARVRPDLAVAGTELHMETTLHHGTHMVAVNTAPLPFFNPARKTAK